MQITLTPAPLSLAIIAGLLAALITIVSVGNNVGIAAAWAFSGKEKDENTKILSVKSAVILLTLMEIIGALLFSQNVAGSLKQLVFHTTTTTTASIPSPTLSGAAIVGALLAALICIILVARLRLPVSSTQAVIISILSAYPLIGGFNSVAWIYVLLPVLGWAFGPLLSGMFAYFMCKYNFNSENSDMKRTEKMRLFTAFILGCSFVCIVSFDSIMLSGSAAANPQNPWALAIAIAAALGGGLLSVTFVKYGGSDIIKKFAVPRNTTQPQPLSIAQTPSISNAVIAVGVGGSGLTNLVDGDGEPGEGEGEKSIALATGTDEAGLLRGRLDLMSGVKQSSAGDTRKTHIRATSSQLTDGSTEDPSGPQSHTQTLLSVHIEDDLDDLDTVSETGSIAGSTVGLTQNLADIELDTIIAEEGEGEGEGEGDLVSVEDEQDVIEVKVKVENENDNNATRAHAAAAADAETEVTLDLDTTPTPPNVFKFNHEVTTLLSMLLLSLAHGVNDIPNILTPFVTVLRAVWGSPHSLEFEIPFWSSWLFVLCIPLSTVMALPLSRLWVKRQMDYCEGEGDGDGEDVVKVKFVSLASIFVVSLLNAGGLPISVTQIVIGAYFGAQIARRHGGSRNQGDGVWVKWWQWSLSAVFVAFGSVGLGVGLTALVSAAV